MAAVLLLVAWLWYTPAGLLGKGDAIGYAICHRIDARSFHLGDRQVPVCARCTGQYLGAMLSLSYLALRRPRRIRRPNWAIIGILLVFVAFYAVDGVNSYLHLLPGLDRFYLYEPSNSLRLATGTALGLGIGIMLFPAFNQTIWKRQKPLPVLDGFLDFGVLLLLGVIVNLLVLSENPLILYPLALISAGGVFVILTMVYSMVVVMVFKVENIFEYRLGLIYPLVAGFIIALAQIAALDYIRFVLTGTWNGFHLG